MYSNGKLNNSNGLHLYGMPIIRFLGYVPGFVPGIAIINQACWLGG